MPAAVAVSATVPKDVASRLRLEAGERVLAIETDRGILLTPFDPVAERALNHKIRGVEGIYDQHDYFSERKIALAKWAALLVDVANSATQG